MTPTEARKRVEDALFDAYGPLPAQAPVEVTAADLRLLLAENERLRAGVLSGSWAQAGPTMRWAQVQRLRFIAHLLESQGHVNRADLVEKFGISTPSASADMHAFMKWNPGVMSYDATAKTFTFARAALQGETP